MWINWSYLMRGYSSEAARWEAFSDFSEPSELAKMSWRILQQQQAMTLDPVRDSFKGVLLDTELDPALIAEILAIPTICFDCSDRKR